MRTSKPTPPSLSSLLSLFVVAVLAAGCGADDPSENSSQDNNTAINNGFNNQAAPNNTTGNNAVSNNMTSFNNAVQDMGGVPNEDMASSNNATSPGNNTSPPNNMMAEPPPLRDGAFWPKFRADLEQTGRVDFMLTDDGSDLWSFPTERGIFSSPVIDADENIYIGSGDNVFYSLGKDGGLNWSFETGEVIERGRLSGAVDNYFASPVGADGKVYMVSQNGLVSVLEAGGSLESLALNDLDEPCYATPAIADGRIYLRTGSALYCFGMK